MAKTTKKKTPINYDNENYHSLLLVLPVIYRWYITNPNMRVYIQAFKQIAIQFYDLLPLVLTVAFILIIVGFFLESR